MPGPGYAELGALSNFTFLEGASHPHELVERSKALGHAALGIADRNSFAGLVRGHVAAAEAGLRFVPGARVRLPEDGSEYLAWPTDRAAYGRLARLLSKGRMEAPKGECRITRDDLIGHADGLAMALLPLEAPDAAFAERLARDAAALRRRLALPLFCAADHRFRADDRKRLDLLAAMADAAGAPLLAAGGVRFHDSGRRRLADVLAAIRLRTTVDDLGFAAAPNAEAHLKPEAEVRRLFAGHEDAVDATMRVVEACRFSLRDLSYEYPEEILDEGLSPQQTLERRAAAAMLGRWPGGAPAGVRKQIAHELALIARLGYAPYFLTVHEIVRFAVSKGILCQGRGSAANSALCYALGITSVAPDKHDLLFERFVSAERDEPPDIDVDFEHERREEVIQHIYERYGRHRAAIAATVIRYRDRSAIREVGRAMGLSEDVTAGLAKATWGIGRATLAEAAAERGLDPARDGRLRMACELAEELVGFPRHLSTHVGGFVITRGPLTELAIVTRAAMEGRHTIEWDKDDIDALRILKVDVLGLGMLTCVRRAFALIEAHGGPALTLHTVPQDDPETYAMLRRADSVGVFQVESRAQMNMLPRLRPEKFYDLVIEVAIVRPGPIQGDMVHPYLRRKSGLEEPTYPSEALRGVLEKTLGVPLFQEQAMQIAIVGAGFPPERADQLRRAMATFRHVGTVHGFREEFVAGMGRNGYAREFAERCFSQIEGFGTYGFPESHAAAFAQLVYVSAWIKRHHPAAFAAALLNSQPMGFYAPAQLVRDAREHGVRVRPVDVLRSDWDCTLEPDAESEGGFALRLGLRMVQGLSKEAAARLVETRPAWSPLHAPDRPGSAGTPARPLRLAGPGRAPSGPTDGAGGPTPSALPAPRAHAAPGPMDGPEPMARPVRSAGLDRRAPPDAADDAGTPAPPARPTGGDAAAPDRSAVAGTRAPPARSAVSSAAAPDRSSDAGASSPAARSAGPSPAPPSRVRCVGNPAPSSRSTKLDLATPARVAGADASMPPARPATPGPVAPGRAEGAGALGRLARAAGLDRAALERLAGADAFRGLGLDRRAALWEATAAEPPTTLPAAAIHEPAALLPEATAGEQTVLDYASTALTLRHHPLALLRPVLAAEGLADTRALFAARRGARLRLPGLVLVRQRPGSAKGVVFFTVEDEWGTANLVVYADLVRRFRAAVVSARLVVAEGTVERTEAEVPIVHLIVRRLLDRSELLAGLSSLDRPGIEPWKRALARADEVEKPDLRDGPRARLPRSRDFH